MSSDRGLCDGLTACPEEFYRLRCVVVCDLETSCMRRLWPTLDRSAKTKQIRNESMQTANRRYMWPGFVIRSVGEKSVPFDRKYF
jgi:hypothetical protein